MRVRLQVESGLVVGCGGTPPLVGFLAVLYIDVCILLFACFSGVPLILCFSLADACGGTYVCGGMPQSSYGRLGALSVPEGDVIRTSVGDRSICCHCVSIMYLCISYLGKLCVGSVWGL